MNQKEAMTALMLGLKVRQRRWTTLPYVYIQGKCICDPDGVNLSSVTDFLTQDHNDWEIVNEHKGSISPDGTRAEGT